MFATLRRMPAGLPPPLEHRPFVGRNKEQVDKTVEKAIAAGGKPWKPAMEEGHMHGGSFQDLDGHVWELMYMEQQ